MTAIKAIIIEDAETWLRHNIRDLTADSVCSIRKATEYNLDGETTFIDIEEDSTKQLTLADFVRALQMLANLIGDKKLFVGGLQNPIDLSDAGNWDVEVVDAFRQLAFHGEVIYG